MHRLMTASLKDWLENADAALRWIEPDGYATRAYAGGDANWMAEAQTAVSTLAQANSALGSRVLSLDVVPALLQGEAPAADGADPLAAAEAALGADDAGVERARGVAKAAEHTLGGRVDLVLRLPSPSALLRMFGAAPGGALTFDDLDDAAMLLANVARRFSDYRFAGLMLAMDGTGAYTEDEFEALDSILSTVRHYRWLSILRVDACPEPESLAAADVDVLLLPGCPPSRLAGEWRNGTRRLGGGLSREFWSGEDFVSVEPGALYYGDAPGDTEPEQLLERLRALPG